MLQIPQVSLPKLIIFDFDNVMYHHTDKCNSRMLGVAGAVGHAYTGFNAEAVRQNHVRCWYAYKDGFQYMFQDEISYSDPSSGETRAIENPIKKEFRKRQYLMAHHSFESILRNDVHGIKDTELPKLLDQLSQKTQICIASHAVTKSLHMMIDRTGFHHKFLKHAFGMTCLGGEGWARKDDIDSGVYLWLCEKYGVDPSDAMMIEDTAKNLKGAHSNGLQTVFINWGREIELEDRPYVDFNFKTTQHFFRHALKHGFVAARQRTIQKSPLIINTP
jgi:FMN phosphatase YigB (HAD superfamily)